MTIDAPAKVNLALRVLGRRPDGYHAIETLMVPVSLCDRLTLRLLPSGEAGFTCSDPSLPAGDSNLAHRARSVFFAHLGCSHPVQMHLEKRIPHGAGLGGGSSDAAAVLVGLDRLLETHLTPEELEILAAQLGSDVPFFIRCRAALCQGRGEIVTPVAPLPQAELLLVKPPFPVSTPWAYQTWSDGKKSEATFPQRLGSIALMNDLEGPVFSRYLVLPGLKNWLLGQPGVAAAMMSGSGSTVFAVLREGAEDFSDKLAAAFGPSFQTFRCHLLGGVGHRMS